MNYTENFDGIKANSLLDLKLQLLNCEVTIMGNECFVKQEISGRRSGNQ